MNAIAFDTLALARKLEAAGFTAVQAQGAPTALSEALNEAIATKRDVSDAEMSLRRDLAESRASLKQDLAESSASLKRDLAEVEARLTERMARLESSTRADLRDLETRLIIKLGAMVAASVVLVAALVKLF